MYCPRCGTAALEAAAFCISCGSALPTLPVGAEGPSGAGVPPAGPVERRRPLLVTLLACVELLAALVVGAAATAFVFGALDARDGSPGLAITAAMLFLLAALHVTCAIGLFRLRAYGRWLAVALAILGLVVIPLGTIVGILVLIYMFQAGMPVLFSRRDPQDFTPQEAALLRRLAESAGAPMIALVAVIMSFVMIGLVGMVAAIAIPNLLNAIQRGKQKRTMADMQTIATAVESYATDTNRYPEAGSPDELAKILEPIYVKVLPRIDGWARPFEYAAVDGGQGYAIASAGKDGEWESVLGSYEPGPTTSFDADIVFQSGQFVRWPDGAQQ